MAQTDNLKDDSSDARTPEDSGGLQPKSGAVEKESTAKTDSATQDAENEPKPAPATTRSSEPSIVGQDESVKTGLVDHVIRWGPLVLIAFLILVMSD